MAYFSSSFIDKVRNCKTTSQQLATLKGSAANKRCFIAATGPSLGEYSTDYLNEVLQDELVFTVKQSFNRLDRVADFLFLNTWNFQKYRFNNRRPIIVREYAPGDPPVFGDTDIELVVPEPSDMSKQLALTKRFDDYTFDKVIDRPWGPGILFEVVFYMAYHMGVTEIVTLGWDVGITNSPVMPHFFEEPTPEKLRLLRQSKRITDTHERNQFMHDNFLLYNKPRIIPNEVVACSESSGDWGDWLLSKGVEVKVVSKQSMVAERIPRVRLEEIFK